MSGIWEIEEKIGRGRGQETIDHFIGWFLFSNFGDLSNVPTTSKKYRE